MNNEWLIKHLTNISFSSQEQITKIGLFQTVHQNISEKEQDMLNIMEQSSHDLDMLTQLIMKAIGNMGELHVSE